jgi:formate dehydrogenase major subunit
MLRIVVDGRPYGARDGATVLEALRAIDVHVPALCHDERLRLWGGCRLCLVQVHGRDRPVAACTTPLADGMTIETHTPELDALRRTLLGLLAEHYPADAYRDDPEVPFHVELRRHGLDGAAAGRPDPTRRDDSHPYIAVDMSRCIACERCVRICDELQGQGVWRVWDRGDRTTIRPDGPSLLESACTSCGACVDTCPTGALEDRSRREGGVATDWVRTTCPYCGTGCELSAGRRDGRIVAVRPVLDAPVSKGHLCAKGRYAFGFVAAPDRITEPMIRSNGRWHEVSWDAAIAFVAERFEDLRRRRGPDCIGVLGSARASNEDNYVIQKFARTVLGTNNVDCCARVCHAPSAAALKELLGAGAATNAFDDIEAARTILVCGANPTENHPIVGARIRQAGRAGASLVVIDPRRIELAAEAAVHLAPRPGTNVPLLNAIAATIVGEGLYDRAFLAARVDGFDAYVRAVAEWTPARAAALCGVDEALIRAAARLYAARTPAMIVHGLGVTEHVQGTDGVTALANLALLTGNVGKPGAGVNPLRGQNNVQGAAHMGCEPALLTGSASLAARTPFEAAWHAAIPERPGLRLLEMLDAARDGRLAGLWAIGYDILLTNPDASRTRAALDALELVVVQDLFLNETARACATVLLPACSSFEKDGTFMNAERRVQRVRQVVPPRGGSKADWIIVRDVARAMGHGPQFAYDTAEDVWNEVRAVWPDVRGMSYARLEKGGLCWPCPSEDHPGTAILHRDSFSHGVRARLHSIPFRPTPEVTDDTFPFLLTTGRTLHQFNAGTMTGRTPSVWLRDTDRLEMAPADAARLALAEGARVRLVSRYGEAVLPVSITARVGRGELFATFHSASVCLNQLTGRQRDPRSGTPEYKVTAVRVDPLA